MSEMCLRSFAETFWTYKAAQPGPQTGLVAVRPILAAPKPPRVAHAMSACASVSASKFK